MEKSNASYWDEVKINGQKVKEIKFNGQTVWREKFFNGTATGTAGNQKPLEAPYYTGTCSLRIGSGATDVSSKNGANYSGSIVTTNATTSIPGGRVIARFFWNFDTNKLSKPIITQSSKSNALAVDITNNNDCPIEYLCTDISGDTDYSKGTIAPNSKTTVVIDSSYTTEGSDGSFGCGANFDFLYFSKAFFSKTQDVNYNFRPIEVIGFDGFYGDLETYFFHPLEQRGYTRLITSSDENVRIGNLFPPIEKYIDNQYSDTLGIENNANNPELSFRVTFWNSNFTKEGSFAYRVINDEITVDDLPLLLTAGPGYSNGEIAYTITNNSNSSKNFKLYVDNKFERKGSVSANSKLNALLRDLKDSWYNLYIEEDTQFGYEKMSSVNVSITPVTPTPPTPPTT